MAISRDKELKEVKPHKGLKSLGRNAIFELFSKHQHPAAPSFAPGGFIFQSSRLEKFAGFQFEHVRQGAGLVGPGLYTPFE